MPTSSKNGLSVIGLFAGIGGIEEGLRRAGHETDLLCEIDPDARRVLQARFPGVPLREDVRSLRSLPSADVVAAGFPCTDLSQAGYTKGISGPQSKLVEHVFRLIEGRRRKRPTWILLENVPFMLHLQRGRAIKALTRRLEGLGYLWAYRVVDTRAFGLPHRRRRILLVASSTEDPRSVLFRDRPRARIPAIQDDEPVACGFYWTEGTKGLGWAPDSIPALKGGSGVGIPSPPGVWAVDGSIGTPEIRDAERLQGFPENWSAPAEGGHGRGARWRLVGNAVSVPVARWLGDRVREPHEYDDRDDLSLASGDPWPSSAWGWKGKTWKVASTETPNLRRRPHLDDFLRHPLQPLSARATRGFLRRLRASTLRCSPEFVNDLERHLQVMALSLR